MVVLDHIAQSSLIPLSSETSRPAVPDVYRTTTIAQCSVLTFAYFCIFWKWTFL